MAACTPVDHFEERHNMKLGEWFKSIFRKHPISQPAPVPSSVPSSVDSIKFGLDQPLHSSDQDLLGRKGFAKNLATAITRCEGSSSIVIGLYGTWGSGKTSLINMAIEGLNSLQKGIAGHRKVIVIRFSPWNFSDQNTLIAQFFEKLSAVLNRKDQSQQLKDAGKRLRKYSALLTPATYIPGIKDYAKVMVDLTKESADKADGLAEAKAQDLDAIKLDLNLILANANTKLLIVIDDIDRLSNVEIKQIFQLVKCLADFTNTIYLLSFDRSVVVNALKSVQGCDGSKYLEKIIQIPFEIPSISDGDLQKIFLQRLQEIVGHIPEERWDNLYWSNLYHSGIRHLLSTIRDVDRLNNTLRLSFPLVEDEVNACDFIAITAIQIFAPSLYQVLREDAEDFTGTWSDHTSNLTEKVESLKKRCERAFRKSRVLTADQWSDFLTRLFPRLERVYGNGSYDVAFLREWRNERRVCSPEINSYYFELNVPKDQLSRKQLESLEDAAPNNTRFRDLILQYGSRETIESLMTALYEIVDKTEPDSIGETFIGILKSADSLPETDETDMFRNSTSARISYLLRKCLQKLPDTKRRYALMLDVIANYDCSLHILANLVSWICEEQSRFPGISKNRLPEDKWLFPLRNLEEIEKALVLRIKRRADEGSLVKECGLDRILIVWQYLGGKSDVSDYVCKLVNEKQGLFKFIKSFVYKKLSRGSDDYSSTVEHEFSWEMAEQWISREALRAEVGKVCDDKALMLDDEERKFLDLIKGDKTGGIIKH